MFDMVLLDAHDWKATAGMRGAGQIQVTRKADGRTFAVTAAEKVHYLAALEQLNHLGVSELVGRVAAIFMLRKLCEAVADRSAEWYSLYFGSEPAFMAQWFIREAVEEIEAFKPKGE